MAELAVACVLLVIVMYFCASALRMSNAPAGPIPGDVGYVEQGIPSGGVGRVRVVKRGYIGVHDARTEGTAFLSERGLTVRVTRVDGSVIWVEDAFAEHRMPRMH